MPSPLLKAMAQYLRCDNIPDIANKPGQNAYYRRIILDIENPRILFEQRIVAKNKHMEDFQND